MANELDAAWSNYDQALTAFYTSGERAVRGAEELAWTPDVPARAAALVDASAELAVATVPHLADEEPSQRELAELKLLAQAALDLTVANDLVELAAAYEEGAAGLETERGESALFLKLDLRPILETPIESGIRLALPDAFRVVRAVWTDDPVKARRALANAAQDAADDIVDAAADVGESALGGVQSLVLPDPAGFLGQAAGSTCEAILEHLGPAVSELVGQAARLVGQALGKLLALLGKEAADKAREKAVDWLMDWLAGAAVKAVLEALYEPDRIVGEVRQLLGETASNLVADPFNQANQAVEDLVRTFEEKTKVAGTVLKTLKAVQKWLVTLQPYGPVAVGAAYLATVGYAVLSGGDHIDWYRLEPWEKLDRVPGVRHLVREAVAVGN